MHEVGGPVAAMICPQRSFVCVGGGGVVLLERILTKDDVDGERRLIRAARVNRAVGSIIHAGGSVFHSFHSSFQLTGRRVHTRLQNRAVSNLLPPLVPISASPSVIGRRPA